MHRRGHFVFELGVQQRRGAHQRDDRLVADRDRDRQIFAARLRMRQVDRDIVLRHGLDADAVRAFHLQPVAADVLDVVIVPIVGIAETMHALSM